MAQVIRIAPGAPVDYVDAVDRYLGAAGVADSSRPIYRISLTTWAWLLTGEQPLGAQRRRLDPAPAPPLRPHPRGRGWRQHADAAGPLPACLGPLA